MECGMGMRKDARSAQKASTVTLKKSDEAGLIGQRLKTGMLVMSAGLAAGVTVYFYGDELRNVIGVGFNWLGERIAGLL
jgi:hypothetical protein